MGDKKYDKRIMAAVRLVLLIAGFLLGASCAGVFFKYNPDIVRAGLQIVFMASSGLLLGVALLLSARPIVALALAIAGKLKNFFAKKKPVEVVGYALGIGLGLMVTFFAYVLLSALIPIVPLNVLLTLVIAFVACIVGAIVCAKWLQSTEAEEPTEPADDYTGYVITSGALLNPKAESLVGDWLTGNVFVLGVTVETLVSRVDDADAVEALKTYKLLKESGKLKSVNYTKSGRENEDVLKYAQAKRLVVITGDEEESALYADTKALCLSALGQ